MPLPLRGSIVALFFCLVVDLAANERGHPTDVRAHVHARPEPPKGISSRLTWTHVVAKHPRRQSRPNANHYDRSSKPNGSENQESLGTRGASSYSILTAKAILRRSVGVA